MIGLTVRQNDVTLCLSCVAQVLPLLELISGQLKDEARHVLNSGGVV